MRRTSKKSMSSIHSTSDKSGASDYNPTEGESPLATLKVQILGCSNLPAADFNGKSDPYVTLEFGGMRVKTPVIKKQLNPLWPAKDATFEFPIYGSAIHTRGAYLHLVVWDKDMIGKDYLGELSLPPTQWFGKKGNDGVATVLAFNDPSNDPLSYSLTNFRSYKHRRNDPKPNEGPPSIQIKIGLVLPHHPMKQEDGSSSIDLTTLFERILHEEESAIALSEGTHHNVFARSPSQGFGSIFTRRFTTRRGSAGGGMTSDSTLSDASPQSSPLKPRLSRILKPTTSTSSLSKKKKRKMEFMINWEGTMIDYEFSSKKAVVGILMLEIKQAMDLPKLKGYLSTGWEMDAFLSVKHDSNVYKTKVVQHDLNPTYGDKFILFIKRSSIDPYSPSSESKLINIQLRDRERTTSLSSASKEMDSVHIGDAQLDITRLLERAPKPDEETGLFSEEAMSMNSPDEFEVELELVDKGEWDNDGMSGDGENGKGPRILVRGKYDPHGAMRQRYWRYHLKEFGLDHSGLFSYSELSEALDRIGVDATKEHLLQFFKNCNKNPNSGLTIEEAMRCLEGEFGSRAEIQQEKEQEEEEQDAVEVALLEPVSEHTPHPEPEDLDPNSNDPDFLPHPGPPPSSTLGHSRESLHDLEQRLTEIFLHHPRMFFRSERDRQDKSPVVPVNAIPDILATFSERHDGLTLLPPEKEVELRKELDEMGEEGKDVGPEFLMTFIARVTGVEDWHPHSTSGDTSVGEEAPVDSSPLETQEPLTAKPDLGSGASAESTATVPSIDEDADKEKDKDKNPAAAKSTDSIATTKSSGTRTGSRTIEAPIPPSTPKESSVFAARQRSTPLEAQPPSSWLSRPTPAYKRKSSGSVGSIGKAGSDTEDMASPELSGGRRVRGQSNPISPPSSLSPYTDPSSSPLVGSQSVPTLPRKSQDRTGFTDKDVFGTDIDPQGEGRHVEHEAETERTSLHSVSSGASGDRVETLEKIRQEQAKKLTELQQKLKEKINEHELEMEEMDSRMEEIAAELDASKRAEKELRAKDHQNSKQLITVENGVTRLQAALNKAQLSCQALQKSNQEQCNEADKYREMIRRKELEMKDSEEYLAVIVADVERWKTSVETAQQMIVSLNMELDAARNAVQALETQKQENHSLKETIDRLRFQLDQLRGVKSTHGGSPDGTITHSLADELRKGFEGQNGGDDPDLGLVETGQGDESSTVQTVVTRQKFGRSPRDEKHPKIYSEASAQHTTSNFVASESSQTEPEPSRVTQSMDIQTELEKLPLLQEPKPFEDDCAASSAAKSLLLGAGDETPVPGPSQLPPPPYAHLLEEEREKIGMEELAKWHSGIHSLKPVPNGISSDAVEEWSHVKEELGVTCTAIDEIVQKSETRGPRVNREPIIEREQSFFGGMRGTMGVLFGATIFGMIVLSTGRALHPTGLTRDQRLWAIYNDVARAGLMDGWLTHAAVAPAWAVLRSLNPAHARLGWVPT